jgi:hypothetical protein
MGVERFIHFPMILRVFTRGLELYRELKLDIEAL